LLTSVFLRLATFDNINNHIQEIIKNYSQILHPGWHIGQLFVILKLILVRFQLQVWGVDTFVKEDGLSYHRLLEHFNWN